MLEPQEEEQCGRRDAEPENREQSLTGRRTQQRGIVPLSGNRQPCRSPGPAGPPAPRSRPLGLRHRPLPTRAQSTATRLWSSLRGIRRGPLTRSPCNFQGGSWEKEGWGQRETQGSAAKGRPCKRRRASELGGDGAWRGGGFQTSLLLPASSWAGPRPRGAALGRGQHFFVSPALSPWHCGGPHSGSGDGRLIKDKTSLTSH